ncbi:DDE-type integrase/transposase/recombinase [Nicoliella spurrieriana]|uniref:DDE-type integrase/transposase/recombinase n=1 Tax=Nicoliella spurrieriana TaxID=2925830 RepID=UPI003C6E9FAB
MPKRPNLIKKLTRSKSVWRADITYLELKPGTWVYLGTAFDDQSSNVLAYKISKSMTSELVKSTIIDALRDKKYLHSDMGSQYTISQFEKVLKVNHIRQSYSKKGNPYDSPIEAISIVTQT